MNPQAPIEQLVDEVYESATPAMKNQMLAQLVGQVYETAPNTERKRLVEHLMKPLGILSLAAVANGIFVKIRFKGGWSDVPARMDDVQGAQGVQVSDVIDLANFAQQVSSDAIGGVAHMLASSPVMASSVAAALLVKIVLRRR
ncbi:MAG TPA: hypothetical protein PLC34_10515 [Burkholderiaceae bacterium]|nr:hypothetical protein [Burkholderiaceae bacterium]